jgi:hypothetical protein
MTPEELRQAISPPSAPQRCTPTINMSNLDAGLCPRCSAMVKEIAPRARLDFRIAYYVCVENSEHRFSKVELDRKGPSPVQLEAWAGL